MFDNNILLKEKLSQIKGNNYLVPSDISAFDFARIMMENIGSPDPELRDLLIHRVISNWIMNNVFTNEQLIELLNINMDDNHLFYKIGEQEDDSVFMRSFCVLNVGTIIYTHRNNKFLSETTIKSIKEILIQYYLKEKDLRGHVDDKGWADSASHGADALDEVALCASINHDDLLDILNAIKSKVCINHYTYIDFEDERITTAVVSVINRNILEHSEIKDWIKDFKNIAKTGEYHVDFRIIMNIRNFLRSLYFRLLDENNLSELIESIKETLNCIKQY
jgi:hypothetical protein